jgi:predicted N-acetyltransferase YhbS
VRVNICPFGSGDAQAVREVHLRAFAGSEDEARLVESLHAAGAAPVSLVAVDEASKGVVGHVLFSPVEVDNGGSSIRVVGLAPSECCRSTRGKGLARASSVRDWRPVERQPTMPWSCSGSRATTPGSASSGPAVMVWATSTA